MGIICAVKQGVRTLSKYLGSKKSVDNFSQRITLESIQRAVQALLGFGVDPNVKTIERNKICRPLVTAAVHNHQSSRASAR